MGFGDNEPPAVRLDALPATLTSPNRIHIMWITFVGWDFVHVRWAVDGSPETQIRLGSDQVAVGSGGLEGEWDLQPTIPRGHYGISVQACRQGAFGVFPASCGPWSDRIEVRGAQNSSSIRAFLVASGIDMSRSVSVRGLRQGASSISLRALLAGN